MSSYPVGFKCVELNIMELDEILKNFMMKNKHMLNFDKSPSWKFPHKSIESLEISSIIAEYYSRNLPQEILYTELMEIFVDRLYFGLLGIHQFLSSTITISHSANNSGEFSNVTHHYHLHGVGDCESTPADDHNLHITWDAPMTKWTNNEADNKPPIQAMVNVGEILKRIHSMLNSEMLQSPVSSPVDHHHQQRKLDLGEKGMQNDSSDSSRNRDKKEKSSSLPSSGKSKGSQTELRSLEGCESCWLCQNVLRLIAEHIDKCWAGLSAGVTTSKISTLRGEMKDNIWEYSQRGVILRWCEALEADTLAIKEKGQELAKIHSEKQDTLEACKESSLMESKRTALMIEDLELKLKVAENDLNLERKGKKEWMKQRDELMGKVKEMESGFNKKTKECESHEMDVKRLNEAIQRLEESYKAEQSAHSESSKEVGEMRKQLDFELKEKQNLSKRVSRLATQLELKDHEIGELNRNMESLKVQQEEVASLKKALEEYKSKAQEMESSHSLLAKMQERYTREIKKLKDDLEVSESKVELLTLYPDLNGPINPPSDDASNPVRTMELQVRSNMLRVEVLKIQSERLTNAMNKIKSKLNL